MPRTRIAVDNRTLDFARAVLGEGETLLHFVESAIRQAAASRQARSEFLRRGIAAAAEARSSGRYRDADAVLAELESILQSKESGQSPQ